MPTHTTHTFTVNVRIDVELIETGIGAASLLTVSPIPQLAGSGTLRPLREGGWHVKFQCNTEHPLEGFSPKREFCIEMVRKHITLIALNMREGD